MLQRALRTPEAKPGVNHYKVAITLANLANAHADLGDPARARDMPQWALAIQEAHCGADDCH